MLGVHRGVMQPASPPQRKRRGERYGLHGGEGVRGGRVLKPQIKKRDKDQEEKLRMERLRKKREDRRAYKETMEKSKKFKAERKKSKAHCER